MKKADILKFYQTYRLFIFPAVVALSSLFLILFVIYPQTAKLISNQEDANALFAKSKILATKAAALKSINPEDVSQKVSYALQSLPADKDYGSTLDLLQQLIAQSGFSIASISFGSSSKVGDTDGFEVKLEVKGVKILLQSLLNNLENSSRLVRINSIDVASSQGTQAIDVSLAVEILYSQLPQSFGAEDAPLPQISQAEDELLAIIARTTTTVTTSETGGVSSPRGKVNPFE
ncbi:hypothetical protein A3I48_02995 [Candidatus Daviesbacteria bacterium RIFCSPLOWO2_02_FULL_36_7]|uniref:Uncharacterized protein n=1 Tax=Candidatus Daviesbacteria bacterium RIFCSPLOWO2_02_FULL_36_7 TaxID=1797792 RepID=A0A1F5MG54_9BACT|nr:MAG: hypothetical protein A3I48_02995 [Candidatus Daviesbacteria bacterium RIFCSPLOWO2_02_FULL_36_7]